MNCEIIRDLLPLYADRLASEESRRQIEEHATHCPACKKLLEEMTAPLEQEPEDEEQRVMRILQNQLRKQRRKTILTWVAALLAVVAVIWGIMELRYSGTEIYVSTANEERILKEMPEVALTGAEKELAAAILEVPMIRDALREDLTDSTTLDTAEARAQFASILPEDAKIFEVFVIGHSVYFSYTVENIYTCLTYNDPDMTGHVDLITKTVAVSPLEEIGSDGKLGDVKATYELIYDVATNTARYQKIKSRHMWFSFLEFA